MNNHIAIEICIIRYNMDDFYRNRTGLLISFGHVLQDVGRDINNSVIDILKGE